MSAIENLDNNKNGLIDIDEIKKSLLPNGFLSKVENVKELYHTLLEQEIESSDEINQSFNESLLNAINDITTNKLDILQGQNIDLLNLRYKLQGMEMGQEKEGICDYLHEQIKHITTNVNKKIAQNKEGNINYYQQSEIKAIQLFTNFMEGTNITITGERGNNILSVDPNTNEGLTNIAIYKLELATRNDIMEYRNLLKQPIFENLLNIPNIEAQLNGLSIEDKNIILSDFLGFFLKIKSSGMHYENLVGSDVLEDVLHNLILAIKYKDKTIDELVADEKIYYLQTKGIQDLSDETHLEEFSRIEATIRQYKTPGDYFNKIISSYKNDIYNFSQEKKQRENEISLIKKINNLSSLKEDLKDEQYKEIFNNQYFDSLPEEAKNILYFQIEHDYTEEEICHKYPFIYEKIKDAERKINEEYKEHERIADIISQYNSTENFSIKRATREEYEEVWPQDANANKNGLEGTLQNYEGHIGDSRTRTFDKRNDFVPYTIFTIQVPGCQPITVQIDQYDEQKFNKLFSNNFTDKLILYNYKGIASSYTKRGTGDLYDYNRIKTSNEKDIRKLSISDFALARKDANGSISLRKMTDPSHHEKVAVETINSDSIKKVDILTTESLSMLSCKEMNTLRDGLDIFNMQDEINSLISKMDNVKIDWKNIGKNILLSGAMSENPNINIDFFPTTKGQFTEDDVNSVFTSCLQMQDLCKKMKDNKQHLENLHKKILEMKKGSDNTRLTNEMEHYIDILDTNISKLLAAIQEGGAIDQFCKFALNKKNINRREGAWDMVEQRFKDNGVKILCAIGCAVAVICAVPSGGASLLGVAALGAAGGMVGSRLGQRANEGLNNISKTTIEVNGKVRTISYDDPTDVELVLTGKMGKIDFVKGLTKEFIIGTISTFGMMKVGQRIGQGLSKSHPKLAQKIRPKAFEDTSSQYTEDVFNSIARNGNQSFLNRFKKEFLEECGEEITETGGDIFSEQAGIPFIGTVFSIYHCLTPGPGSNILNKNKVSFDNFRHNGSNIEIDAYYDENLQVDTNGQTGVQSIIDYYTHNGYEYHSDTQTLTKPNEDTKKYTNVIKLIPTKAEITARNIASSKLGEIGRLSVNHESGEIFYDPSVVKELEIFMVHEKLGSPKIDSNNNMTITLKDGTEIILKPNKLYLINKSVFEHVINEPELKNIALQEFSKGTLEIGENGEILNVYVEVNGEKKPSQLFSSLINGGLTKEQALKSRLQTKTVAFKEWFGDSKIVDENGEPLIMWHGTGREFNEFNHNGFKNFDWVNNTKDWFYFSNNHKFTYNEYATLNRQSFQDIAYTMYEFTKMNDFEGDNWISEFETRWNDIIEGFNSGKTEYKDTGHGYSDLFFNNKQLYIGESLGRLLEGKTEISKDDFEKREMEIEFDIQDGSSFTFTMNIYVPKANYTPINLPFFIKGDNVSQIKGKMGYDINWMDNSFDSAIRQGDNANVIEAYDTENDNLFIGVRDATQIKSAINNDGSFSSDTGKFNDYFGKTPKLIKNADSKIVYQNSQIMDNILAEINEENKLQKLQELRQEINEQYKQVTGEELNLTDEQLLSVLDAHEQDGILGKLTIGQLRQKVRVLSETITDPNVRRFLLEAGFCGKKNNKINIDANCFEVPLKKGKCEYVSIKTGKSPESITKEQAKECFFNGLDVTAQLMEGQSQRAVLSSGSLFLNNPEFMKLGGDIDVATDVQTFRNVALEKQSNGKTKLDQFFAEGKIRDLMFTHIGQNHKEIDITTINESELNLLIAQGDIRVEFNIPSDGIMINCEFFPEPKGYGLIQLGTPRAEGKVNSYTINGREVKTVNEELAAMSYMINLAHEIDNNSIEGIQKGKKLKDSVRINNFLQYLSSVGLNTPHEIIKFIDKTKNNYESQTGEIFTINRDGESVDIDMSDYLRTGIDKLGRIREILTVMEGDYNKTVLLDESWGSETTISFNQFMKETFTIKKGLIDGLITINEAIEKITALQLQIDIKNPKNFAYYYEIYQLRKEFEGKILQIERTSINGERRNLTALRTIEKSEFQNISNETLTEMGNDLRDTFGSTNYDSFDLYLRLINNKKPGESLNDSFRTLDLSNVDTSRGTICTGMARLLQARLSKRGIRSHMIRFQAGGTQNNEYLGDGHTALIAPKIMEDGSHGYVLLDPGLLISQPLVFGRGENPTVDVGGARYKVVYTGNSEYPFSMQQYKINKETQQYELKKEMPFNPDQEWLNPEQTLNPEILRVFTDFKIAKQDGNGNNLALIRFTIGTKTIDIRYKGGEKMPELTVDEFRDIKKSPRYNDFIKACEILGRNPEEMYKELMQGIDNIDEYTSTIQNTPSIK